MINDYTLDMERQQRQQREIERPIVCPECSSNWFTIQTFNQYSDIAYGSGVGGDIRQINAMPMEVRVCVCGHPYAPSLSGIRGKVATAAQGSFNLSLQAAYQLRKAVLAVGKGPKLDMQKLSETFAAAKELEELQEKLQKLEARMAFVNADFVQPATPVGDPAALASVATTVEEIIAAETPVPVDEPKPEAKPEEATKPVAAPHTAPAGVTVVPPSTKPHPNSKEARDERAARIKADLAKEGKA